MRRFEQPEWIFLKIGIDLNQAVCDKTLQRPREKTNGIITDVSIVHLSSPDDEIIEPISLDCDLTLPARMGARPSPPRGVRLGITSQSIED